ncbi:chromatin structure-remodeling complex subunit RSC7 [Lecanora helva]
MVRRSRAQTAAAAKSMGEPFPPSHRWLEIQMIGTDKETEISTTRARDDSDEEMVDAIQSVAASPQPDASENEAEEEVEMDEGDDQGTPAVESDAASRHSTPVAGRSSAPRRRRAGRPPKRGSARRGTVDEPESRDTGSDVGTPRRRGGWRGRGFGGGRWAKSRGGPSHAQHVPMDKDGNMINVKNDEIELEPDEEGEQKVDENGYLKGGREYRVRTFSIEDKGDRLYMLSTEPARCVGFRDSYLFFQKHRNLYKIILAEEAKKDLIERNLIPHSYKGRAIGVVTARSVFREFGARIVIGGKKIIDDYQVQAMKAAGEVEGELANPGDRLPNNGEEYDRNQFVAWHGASAVYHTGGPNAPVVNGEGKKRKVMLTGENWMFEHAREARYAYFINDPRLYADCSSRFNSSIAAARRQNLNGVYDVHTNVMQYPRIMQPTHARWESVSPVPMKSEDAPSDTLVYMNGSDGDSNDSPSQVAETLFPDIPPVYTRNFMISDTYYSSPVTSTLGCPGPDENICDIGPEGLLHVKEDVIAALPEDCRQAFYKARLEEKSWKESWGNENEDTARAKLRITYNT